MQDFYKKWFDKSLQNGANTVINKGLGNYTTAYNAWKRIESIRALFNEEVNQRGDRLSILDVGCGDALPLFILNSDINTSEYYGIDVSLLDIAFAEKLKELLEADNVTFVVGDAGRLPFQDSLFDIVICSEVLEHLKHPEACLKEIRRILKNGGTALISTPNENNFITKFPKIFKITHKESDGNILKMKEHNSRDEHISVRSIKTWRQTFLSTGFSVTGIKRHGILYGGYKYNKHRLLFAVTIVVDWMLDRLSLGQGLSEGVTFKLK
jgi:ubiquinone/menaquinone biosynthesis C-methylase UbiE